MQPLEIDSAVFCDGAHYTIISRENSSILTCPVASGAGGYTLNRVEVRDETPSRFELEQLAAASPLLKANTPGIPVFPGGIAPAANSYTLAGCCRAAL